MPATARVYARDLADDLVGVGAVDQAEYLAGDLEPEDVEALVADLRRIRLDDLPDADLRARIEAAVAQLDRLVRHEAGLTDRYSDDVD